jgi:hypothetical protein
MGKFYVTSDQKQGEQACKAHSLSLQKKSGCGVDAYRLKLE